MWVQSARRWVVPGIFGVAATLANGSVRPVVAAGPASSQPAVGTTAIERGRLAMTQEGFLKPEWSESAYRDAAKLWDEPAPDPDKDP